VTSLGHFIFGSRPVFDFNTSHTVNVARNMISILCELNKFGFKMTESQIPPEGDIHALPALPIAFVCRSAIITVPSKPVPFLSTRERASF
jgi:hypothetical protein